MELILFSVWLVLMVGAGVKIYLAQQSLNRVNRIPESDMV